MIRTLFFYTSIIATLPTCLDMVSYFIFLAYSSAYREIVETGA